MSRADATDDDTTPRELWRAVRRHPRELPERLIVLAVSRQGAPARAWADKRLSEGVDRRAESDRLRRETLVVSRVDGAVSGTPFFVALVPAYVAFLWSQMRMVLRIAALYGHDTTEPGIAAELLALRGVYPSVPEAAQALQRIGQEPPDAGRRARVEAWVDLVRRILVLAAFTSASNPDEHPGRPRQVLTFVAGGALWLTTWVLPVTFMALMSWSCGTSTRQFGAIALEFYSGEAVSTPSGVGALRTRPERGAGREAFLHWLVLFLATVVPIGLLVFSVSQGDALGDGGRVLAALVGLALVIALAVVVRR